MSAIFKIFRIPNLLIIILTQVLLKFYIIDSILDLAGATSAMPLIDFFILVFIFVIMAAAGYLINDFYDIESDRINKPDKVIIGRKVSTMTARVIYAVLNIIAIALGFYLALKVDYYQLGLVFLAIILMLWYYSARYKRMVFWGNLVVSVLLAFTVFAVWLFEFFALRADSADFLLAYNSIRKVQYFVWGFAWFAFITTMIREMIKDIEDVEGDTKVGYNTMPIAIGVKNSSYIIAFVIVLAIASLAFVQYWLYNNGFSYACWYLLITVQLILFYSFIKALTAKEKKDWTFLGNLLKVCMLAGIISMQMIYFEI